MLDPKVHIVKKPNVDAAIGVANSGKPLEGMIWSGFEKKLKTVEYDLREVNAELGAVGTRRTIGYYFCFSKVFFDFEQTQLLATTPIPYHVGILRMSTEAHATHLN